MAMAQTRFLFDNDFRSARPSAAQAREEAARAEGEAGAYARGLAEGRLQAEAQSQARLADAFNRLALAATSLLADSDARLAAVEDECVEVAVALARTAAGDAMAAAPLAALGGAVREALKHVRGVPHLAVRVHESLVDETEALVKREARERGYEGRLVVLGEPDILPGDARIEWADGAIVRDRGRVDRDIDAALGDTPPTRA